VCNDLDAIHHDETARHSPDSPVNTPLHASFSCSTWAPSIPVVYPSTRLIFHAVLCGQHTQRSPPRRNVRSPSGLPSDASHPCLSSYPYCGLPGSSLNGSPLRPIPHAVSYGEYPSTTPPEQCAPSLSKFSSYKRYRRLASCPCYDPPRPLFQCLQAEDNLHVKSYGRVHRRRSLRRILRSPSCYSGRAHPSILCSYCCRPYTSFLDQVSSITISPAISYGDVPGGSE